jgi:tape measure domain-containing protein
MDKLSWIFELVDRVSGPANAINSSLARTERTMIQASGAATRMELSQDTVARSMGRSGNAARAMGNNVRAVSARAGAALNAYARSGSAALGRIPIAARLASGSLRALEMVGRGAMSAMGGLFSVIRNVLSSPLSQLAAMLAPVATILATARGQLDMIANRQRLVRGFDIMLGDGQGERVMQRIVQLSGTLGTDINETATAARELFSKGFDEQRVFELVQGFADLRAVNPGASLDRIALAMGQVRQAGRLQGDELNQLAEGGLNLSRVMPRIAAELGIDPTKVRDAMRAGDITADIFERAVLGAMQDQASGTIGSIAEDMSHTFGGEWDRLSQAPSRFFERVAAGGSESTDRLTRGLRRINEMLDPDSASGQRIVEGLGKALGMLADALEWLSANTGTIGSVFRMFGVVLTPIWWTLTGLAQIVTWVSDAWDGWSDIIGTSLGQLSFFGVWLESLRVNMQEKFTSIVGTMYMFGQNIVTGLTNGIISLAMLPVTAIGSMGDSVLNTLRTALGIHSPSREMAYLGEMVGAGFMVGLDRSGMGTSLDGRIEAPPMSSSAQASALMGNTINVVINVNASDADDGQSLAQQIEAVLMPRLSSVFDSLALEAGV